MCIYAFLLCVRSQAWRVDGCTTAEYGGLRIDQSCNINLYGYIEFV